jgi:hypothetical protein
MRQHVGDEAGDRAWVSRGQHRVDLIAEAAQRHGEKQHHERERYPDRRDGQVHRRKDHRNGRDRDDVAKRAPPGHRQLGPLDQPLGLHAGIDVDAGQCELFAQVQFGSEFRDCLLPRVNFTRIRGRFQPAGQRRLAGARARDRQQLEERALAEQVEIVRVRMVIVAKAIAGLPAADPAVLEPRQAALVEGDRSGGHLARAEHACVAARERREGGERHQEPPEADAGAPRKDEHQYGHEERREARVGVPRIGGGQGVARGTAGVQTGVVLLLGGWRHGAL